MNDARRRLDAVATALLLLAGGASPARALASVLTVETATIDETTVLRVAGRVCDAGPLVRLVLVETRETYPVRLVLEARPNGIPAGGCVPFRAALALATLPPFAEACREHCLIEVRVPGGAARTLPYPGAKGR